MYSNFRNAKNVKLYQYIVTVNQKHHDKITEIMKIRGYYGRKVTKTDTLRVLLYLGIKEYEKSPEYVKFKDLLEERRILETKYGIRNDLTDIVSKIGSVDLKQNN